MGQVDGGIKGGEMQPMCTISVSIEGCVVSIIFENLRAETFLAELGMELEQEAALANQSTRSS